MVKFLADLKSFKAVVSKESFVIIDFTASWCPPCKFIGPIFVALANANAKAKGKDGRPSRLKFFKVDVDKNAEAARMAKIEAMPTFQVWKGGKKVAELVGAGEDRLKALVKKYA